VYEVLYVVETQQDAAREAAAAPEVDPQPEAPAVKPEEEPVDTHAGEVLEDEMVRPVRVRKRPKLAQPDDPRVRERLEHAFSDASDGLLLTAPGVVIFHGPRPLVRARRPPSAAGDVSPEKAALARRLGRELLVKSRPELRRCYEAAFARHTVAVTEGTIEASILPDGTVAKARIVEGGLVDALGDVCLIEHIEATRLAADTTRTTTRVSLPLLFFYQGPASIDEANGMSPGRRSTNTRDDDLLPPVDDFAEH
jgi:hypothetical protein